MFDEINFEAVELGKTPNGKTGVARLSHTGYYVFGFAEGGEIPKELQGAYSTIDKIKNLFIRYLDKVVNNHIASKDSEKKAEKEAASKAEKAKPPKKFREFMKSAKAEPKTEAKEEPKLEVNGRKFNNKKGNPMAAFANMDGVVMLGKEQPPEIIMCTVKER